MIEVIHAQGEDKMPGQSFRVDDKSGALIVFRDPNLKHALCAYNAQFWIHARFADGEGGE